MSDIKILLINSNIIMLTIDIVSMLKEIIYFTIIYRLVKKFIDKVGNDKWIIKTLAGMV